MTQVTVNVHDPEVRRIFSDWDSVVGQTIDHVMNEAEDAAKAIAPVSPTGSWTKGHRFNAYPGYLREHIHVSHEHHYDADGFCLGLLGAPAYPFNFISNRTRKTWNRGRKSARPAVDDVLQRGLDAVPFATYKAW